MKVKNRLFADIQWDLFFVLLIGALSVILSISNEYYFILTAAYFVCLVVKNRKIFLTKYPSLPFYLIFIVYSFVLGFAVHSIRNVIRDLYYVLPSVLWLFIGAQFRAQGKDKFLKTIFLYGASLAILSIIKFIASPQFEMSYIRNVFSIKVYDLGLIFSMMLYFTVFSKKQFFSKWVDRIILLLMAIQISLSMGRISILEPIIMILMILLVLFLKSKRKSFIARQFAKIALLFVAVGIFAVIVIPQDALETLITKTLNSLNEINIKNEYDSLGEISANWRGYEIQMAISKFFDSNLFVQLFGKGMGEGIYIDYVPSAWQDFVVDNTIPLAHNAFVTLLPKGGIFGVLSLLSLFVFPIIVGWKWISSAGIKRDWGIILIAMNVTSIFVSYVVRGPVAQMPYLIWAVVSGYVFSNYRNTNTKIQHISFH